MYPCVAMCCSVLHKLRNVRIHTHRYIWNIRESLSHFICIRVSPCAAVYYINFEMYIYIHTDTYTILEKVSRILYVHWESLFYRKSLEFAMYPCVAMCCSVLHKLRNVRIHTHGYIWNIRESLSHFICISVSPCVAVYYINFEMYTHIHTDA